MASYQYICSLEQDKDALYKALADTKSLTDKDKRMSKLELLKVDVKDFSSDVAGYVSTVEVSNLV